MKPHLSLAVCLSLAFAPLSAAGAEEAPESAAPTAPRPVVSEVIALKSAVTRDMIGTIAARSEADLGFIVAGRLAERPVEAGSTVPAGGALAVLDPEDLDANLRAAEAQVAQAEAQLEQALDAEERARALKKRGVASSVQLESATRARIGAQSALDQARAAQAAAADRRDSTTLTAPEDGIVTATYAETGATLAASQPVLRFASSAGREVVVDMTETDLALLPEGAVFEVALSAHPDVTAHASVTRVEPLADRATRTRRVHLSLDSPPDGLRLGALVTLRPDIDSTGQLSLPQSAVMQDSTGALRVWVVRSAEDGGRQVTARDIEVVSLMATPTLAQNNRVAIAAGLEPGEEVVTRGIHSLTEGQPVGAPVSP